MQLSLYVRRGPTSGQIHPLHESRVTLLGRNSSNHVVLLDRGVSANHCVLRPRSSRPGFVLIDARSRHGTMVNGHRTTKASVGLGDRVTVGPFELEVIETPPGEYPLLPRRPAAERPACFEIAPRGWGKTGEPLPAGSATVVGRSRVAHLVLPDDFISTCHCLICLDPTDDGRMPFVIDLHSSNGTCINRRPVHRKHLLPGDVLLVGDHEFKLRRVAGPVLASVEPEVEIPPAPLRRPGASTTLVPDREPLDLGEAVPVEPFVFAPEPETEPAEAEVLGPLATEPAAAPEQPEPVGALEEVLAPVENVSDDDLIDVFSETEGEPAEAAPVEPEPVVSVESPEEAEPVTTDTAAFVPAAGSPAAVVEQRETAEFVREPAPDFEPAAPVPDAAEEPEPAMALAEASADAAVAAALEDTRALEVLTIRQAPAPSLEPQRLLPEGPADYAEFFGFERQPFQAAPDADCFFDGQHHWDALDTLVRWLKAGPPVAVLFGERGCGKSLLVECLARRLAYRRPAPVVVCPPLAATMPDAVIATALATARELYPDLADGSDGPLASWRAALKDLCRRRGLVALLLDDAHLAHEDGLRALATLLDGDAAGSVVRVLLAGDESLRELVGEPPLAYHPGISCYLQPLDGEEVAPYLALRIFHASGRRELPFTRRAVDLIAEYSCGVPRLINLVADGALRQAFHEQHHQADFQTVARGIRLVLGADAPPGTA